MQFYSLMPVYIYYRQALNEAKKQNHSLLERVQGMQSELSEAEVARSELDGQVRQGHSVSLHILQ